MTRRPVDLADVLRAEIRKLMREEAAALHMTQIVALLVALAAAAVLAAASALNGGFSGGNGKPMGAKIVHVAGWTWDDRKPVS